MANIKEIHQIINSLVPEFNGTNDLTRFLGAADSAYSMVKDEEEKQIFCKLIKFRLTGNVYNRIVNRQIDSYESLKEILNNLYAKVWTLGELERRFIDIKQSYNETIRDFGHRVTEALDNYKMGYKDKYKLQEIDNTYSQHLDNTAILSFKRGINNTILKEKIATCRATKLNEIIDETETTERLLQMTTGTSIPKEPQTLTYRGQQYQNNYRQGNSRVITCNYCQKNGHTYDVCRLRLSTQNNNRNQTNGLRLMNSHNTVPTSNTYINAGNT